MTVKVISRMMDLFNRRRHALKIVAGWNFSNQGNTGKSPANMKNTRPVLANDTKSHPPGIERSAEYYNETFSKDTSFHQPFYQSAYYASWLLIVDRLRRYGSKGLLDIGCGPGQFAGLVADAGFSDYTGIDFSGIAIERARASLPGFDFLVGDIRCMEIYRDLKYDTVICMEVLEHIQEDFQVIQCMKAGSRCLLTVPNFPWRRHVRHFENEADVLSRYGAYFDDATVTRIKGTRTAWEQFFLVDGIRNSSVASSGACHV